VSIHYFKNIFFASDHCSWNSENNPLLIIHDKFKSGLTISVEVLDTSGVVAFASRCG
jgi:hypothetical protein